MNIDRIGTDHDITVFPAEDNFDALADRLIMLFTHGRKVTLVRRLIVTDGPDQLEVAQDLTLDPDESFKVHRQEDPFHRAVTFYFDKTERLSVSTSYVTEKEAASAWGRPASRYDRQACQVRVDGLGVSPTGFDSITVNKINEHGVQYSTLIIFHR